MTSKTRHRILIIVLAPCSALAAWALYRLAGVDLVTSRGGSTTTVGAPAVLAASLIASLAAWSVVRVVERRSRFPRRTWAQVGSVCLGLSVIGPSYLADGASAAALISLHVVTAIVVIAGFTATLPCRRSYAGTPYRSTIRS